MTGMARSVVSVVCAVVSWGMLGPSAAFAGSYVVPACSPGSSPGLWSEVNSAPGGFASGNVCGGPEIGPLDGSRGGSLYAEDILASPADIPDGARAGWVFAAPAGATITAISYYRTLASHGSRDVAAGLFTASGEVVEQCRIARPFGSPIVCSMPNNQVPARFSNLNTTSLFFGVLCNLFQQAVIACSSGGTIHDVQAYMYSARVTVTENVPPTVSDVGGALWGGGLVSGIVRVSFVASDASGVAVQAVQTSSGESVASSGNGCDFAVRPPCPSLPAGAIDVDTTRVADGTQSFRLVVTDPASNSEVVPSPPVIVDNDGPPPPVGLRAVARAGSGVVELSWSDPAAAPAPVEAAMAQLCSASCAPAVRAGAVGSAQLVAPGPGAYTARVWLLDVAGRGGPHNAAVASVVVPPPSPVSPTSGKRIGAVLRGRSLRVSGSVVVSGRVSVSWRSKIRRRTVGHGSRVVTVRQHRVRVTFAIPRKARTHAATIRVAVRSRRHVVGQARARRG
jgi:hypothetical protein